MRGGLLVVAVLAVGCGGGDEEGDGSGQCMERGGSYRMTYSYRTGDCGELGEFIVSPSDASDPSCSSDATTSADGCKVSAVNSCTNPDGTVFQGRLVVTWSEDASSGSGTADIRLSDQSGAYLCQGTYGVYATRL